MSSAIKEKNRIAVISVIALGLALFLTAKLASAETDMDIQDSAVGWYETEDALPYVGMQKSKAMAQKAPEDRQTNTVKDLDQNSWIDTEDTFPKS